ncbi:hypothetical protein EOL96_05015 [Candidatus Saccharibacteria bacterium]|nr:hypothetical protein [Candidatus Saccharibacteria bacterium]
MSTVIITVLTALVALGAFVALREVEYRLQKVAESKLRSAKQLDILKDVLGRWADKTTVFGSSVKSGRFDCSRARDVDLMIEVDYGTFAQWSASVYPGATVQAPVVDCYGSPDDTRVRRWKAAIEVLDIPFPTKGKALDFYLFPHEFVRGELDIPAWNDPVRSFRREVLAGVKLADLKT